MAYSPPLTLFTLLFTMFGIAISANFAGGNFLALRVTSGSALTSAATAFVLEERNSTTGALAQPAISVGVCTLSGSSTKGGQLSESPNGANSAFACYSAAVGASDPGASTSITRGAVILNSDATLNSFVGFGAAYTGPAREVYSAVVADTSINFYVGGDGRNVRGKWPLSHSSLQNQPALSIFIADHNSLPHAYRRTELLGFCGNHHNSYQHH